MSATLPPLLPDAGSGSTSQSRSASSAVLKAASGFHVFRVEGYSLAKIIPGGERISSGEFTVGGRTWRVDLYPNGTDGSRDVERDSDAVSLYLVYCRGGGHGLPHEQMRRFSAQYKFSILDRAGDAAYELPAATSVFTRSGGRGCGHAAFIGRDELERRRAGELLRDGCLAIRCDVGVVDQREVRSVAGGAKRGHSARDDTDTETETSSYSVSSSVSLPDSTSNSSDSDGSPRRSRCRRRRRRRRRRRESPELDEEEYIRWCLES